MAEKSQTSRLDPEEVSLLLRASAAGRALSVLGDGWTVRILRESFLGVTSFERFVERLAIPRQTLANRLQALVAEGVLSQRSVPSITRAGSLGRGQYKLTAKGLDLYPYAMMLWRWERRWGGAHAQALPRTLVHSRCGRSMQPVLACAHCRLPIEICDVDLMPGPGAAFALDTGERGEAAGRRWSEPGANAHTREMPSSSFVFSDRWAHLTVAAVYMGCCSFDAIGAAVGAASNILTHRLQWLVRVKILDKRRSRADARRFEYRLTERGRDVLPLTQALAYWADRWLPNPHGPTILRTHRPCGKRLRIDLRCGECGDVLTPWEVRIGAAGRLRRASDHTPVKIAEVTL